VAPTAVWFSVGFNSFESRRPIGRLPGGAFFLERLGSAGVFTPECVGAGIEFLAWLDRRLALCMAVRRLVSTFPVFCVFLQTAFSKGLVVLDWTSLGNSVSVCRAVTSCARHQRPFGFSKLLLGVLKQSQFSSSVVLGFEESIPRALAWISLRCIFAFGMSFFLENQLEFFGS